MRRAASACTARRCRCSSSRSCWSGGLFLLDDRVLAHANRTRRGPRRTRFEAADRRASSARVATTANWLVDTRGRIYYYSRSTRRGRRCTAVSVFETGPAPVPAHEPHTRRERDVHRAGLARRTRLGAAASAADKRDTRGRSTAARLDLVRRTLSRALQNQDADDDDVRRAAPAHRRTAQTRAAQRSPTRVVTLQERIAFPLVDRRHDAARRPVRRDAPAVAARSTASAWR